LRGLRQSREFFATDRSAFDRVKDSIVAKITENEAAGASLAVTTS
jgi:hypothetical protein